MQRHLEILLTEREIQHRIASLAAELAPRLGKHPLIIGLLKGCYVFTADLMRALAHHGVHPTLDFMVLSSYGDKTVSSGEIRVNMDCREPVAGRRVLVVDDILDTGATLAFATRHLLKKGAREVMVCAFLDKPSRHQVQVETDFVGFTIPNAFVVGYGLDYANHFRELPYVAALTDPDAALRLASEEIP